MNKRGFNHKIFIGIVVVVLLLIIGFGVYNTTKFSYVPETPYTPTTPESQSGDNQPTTTVPQAPTSSSSGGGGGGGGGGSSSPGPSNPTPPATPVCGDGVITSPETCDDSNTADGDGCSSTCAIEPSICGDNIITGLETCDDGNTDSGDGCSSTCQIEDSDGDGILNQADNCPLIANTNQANIDSDFFGDACDFCPNSQQHSSSDPGIDSDLDGVGDPCDLCPDTPIAPVSLDANGCAPGQKVITDEDGATGSPGTEPPTRGEDAIAFSPGNNPWMYVIVVLVILAIIYFATKKPSKARRRR